jgi:hypothetical protein
MARLTWVALPMRCGLPALNTRAAMMLGVALATAPTSALAEAQVRGSAQALTVEAKNAPVREVLAALSGAFDVHYRSTANLEARLTGNYEGSLRRVMKRILDGYSYIVKIGDDGTDLIVLDAPRTAPATGASPSFRLVALEADTTPVQPSLALAAIEPPVIVASPGPASTGLASSSKIVEQPAPATPAQPSRGIAAAELPVPPASPAAPSSRQRDHLVVADGKALRPSPPRKIKMASGPHHWKNGKHHVRRTSLARSSISCTRHVRSFGVPMTFPVSSYDWIARADWRAEAIPARSKGLKMRCRSK